MERLVESVLHLLLPMFDRISRRIIEQINQIQGEIIFGMLQLATIVQRCKL